MKNVQQVFGLFIALAVCSCAGSYPQKNGTAHLDNQVSDGYGTTMVYNKTGASNTVERPNVVLSLDDYMRGLPGVTVTGNGSNAQILIHGVNSFVGSSEPLFVLNGSAMSSYASLYQSINAHDIKRVTVLTDAASAGIYGVRGANGVVVVTLKSGNGN